MRGRQQGRQQGKEVPTIEMSSHNQSNKPALLGTPEESGITSEYESFLEGPSFTEKVPGTLEVRIPFSNKEDPAITATSLRPRSGGNA